MNLIMNALQQHKSRTLAWRSIEQQAAAQVEDARLMQLAQQQYTNQSHEMSTAGVARQIPPFHKEMADLPSSSLHEQINQTIGDTLPTLTTLGPSNGPP
jgi:hypothetical protein